LVRKHRWYPKPHPREDPVTDDLYQYIVARDKDCIFSSLPDHVCRGRITLEHVPGRNENAFGRRAKSDRLHLVVACLDANVNGYASAHRDFAREHIAKVEP
jgi:hypothetical protein